MSAHSSGEKSLATDRLLPEVSQKPSARFAVLTNDSHCSRRGCPMSVVNPKYPTALPAGTTHSRFATEGVVVCDVVAVVVDDVVGVVVSVVVGDVVPVVVGDVAAVVVGDVVSVDVGVVVDDVVGVVVDVVVGVVVVSVVVTVVVTVVIWHPTNTPSLSARMAPLRKPTLLSHSVGLSPASTKPSSVQSTVPVAVIGKANSEIMRLSVTRPLGLQDVAPRSTRSPLGRSEHDTVGGAPPPWKHDARSVLRYAVWSAQSLVVRYCVPW